MAKNDGPDGPEEFRPEDFIEGLVPDPAIPPAVVALVGFAGKSSRPDHQRLYLSLTLDEFVEIPTNAIVQSRSIKATDTPLTSTVVWVRPDARLLYTQTTSILSSEVSSDPRSRKRRPPRPPRLPDDYLQGSEREGDYPT